jgi:cadmium resistance protein CadD (predicted permease)
MHGLGVTLAVGVVVFASTNVDDLLVLLAFFADPRYRARQVVLGQLVGITALTAAGLAAALLSLVLPPAQLGLLGLVPLGLGVVKLVRRPRAEGAEQARGAAAVLAVAAVTIANGGDNLAVYVPLFATRRPWQVAVIAATFLVMTLVWCALSYALVTHATLGPPLRRWGTRLLPFVLIGLGVYILVDSGAARWVLG